MLKNSASGGDSHGSPSRNHLWLSKFPTQTGPGPSPLPQASASFDAFVSIYQLARQHLARKGTSKELPKQTCTTAQHAASTNLNMERSTHEPRFESNTSTVHKARIFQTRRQPAPPHTDLFCKTCPDLRTAQLRNARTGHPVLMIDLTHTWARLQIGVP